MKTLYVRTDANATIGAGHVVRCLSIAHACKEQGMRTVFLVSEEESKARIERITAADAVLTPDEVIVVDASEGKEVGDNVPVPSDASIILLDSYAFDNEYITRLRDALSLEGGTDHAARIAIIDDFNREDLNADIIINYMPDAHDAHYNNADLVLAGLEYAPLRPQFASESAGTPHPPQAVPLPLKGKVQTDAYRILITTGSTDPYGMRDAIRKMLEEIEVTDGTVPRSPWETGDRWDSPPVTSAPSLDIVVADGSVKDMAQLMKECDIAVTAGGTTLLELCAFGVPAVVFAMADNQMRQVKGLAAQGAILYAGSMGDATRDYVTQETEAVVKNIAEQVKRLLEDAALRQALSNRMRTLVDGKGAERIARALANV